MNKTTAKDFFLQLAAFVAFYASIIALITLLFEVINFAYPQITDYYQYYFPSISLQVATLIVAFPIFLIISRILEKSYEREPEMHESWVRRWLSYITLFVAGAVLAGDLVTVIYMFLDGQELTTAFFLKVLVLFVIAGAVFAYYLREIKGIILPKERNGWRAFAIIIVLASIVFGFYTVGLPQEQRERRYDAERVTSLQEIQWQIVNFWQQKGEMPRALSDLEDSISGFRVPVDPKTGEGYEYSLTGALSFELCATFDREAETSGVVYSRAYPEFVGKGDNWQHSSGRHCFDREIDPEFYPVTDPLRIR